MQKPRLILSSIAANALALTFLCSPSLAQSSGNFTAAITTPQCVVDNATGAQSGGDAKTLLTTTIQTPGSSQTTLLITPSLVTGLFTNTEVNSTTPTSSQSAAVAVKVTIDGHPALPATSTTPYVIYDKRFQQLSTDLFSTITECQVPNSNCNIDLILSTLSAHSFNFVATNVGQGVHTLAVSWVFECTGNGGTMEPCDTTAFPANSAGACVGPGSLTVTQTKAFSQSGGITLQ